MALERGNRKDISERRENQCTKRISDQREIQCRKWARNSEIIQCLESIINWSEGNSQYTNVDENVYDWVNNIVWYSKMQGFDPVFGGIKPYTKRGR